MEKKQSAHEEEVAWKEAFEYVESVHKKLDTYTETLRVLCDVIGYGYAMRRISEMWKEKLAINNDPDGGHFVVGPCESMTTACGCEVPHACDWCCGSGWLTRHVKTIKDQQSEPSSTP